MVNFKASVITLALAAAVANATIASMIPRTTPFRVTKHSKLPVTFKTVGSPIYGDVAVIFGISPGADSVDGNNIGTPLRSVDLVNSSEPPVGNFTLQLSLTKKDVQYYQPGQFTLSAAIIGASGNGPGSVSLHTTVRENIKLEW